MNAITSIVPVDELAKLAAPGSAAATPSVSPESAQKFEALMSQSSSSTEGITPTGENKNVLGSMLEKEQDSMKAVDHKMNEFMTDIPNMGKEEMAAKSMALSSELAMSNVKLQIATSLTQGSNKSLQTLLKNQ